jgi:hypothetical protein
MSTTQILQTILYCKYVRVERPFRNTTSGNVSSKLSARDNVGSTGGVKTDRVVDNSRVVLADVGSVVGLETSITNGRQIFLVSLPFQALVVNKKLKMVSDKFVAWWRKF